MVAMMNLGHSALADWGLRVLELPGDARVLKPGGRFLLCNECGGTSPKDGRWTEKIGGMAVYRGDELKEMLQQTGFEDVQVHQNEKGWLCVTACRGREEKREGGC